MKPAVQWVCVLTAAQFVGWTHSHTDEIPVVLGFDLILSAILGLIFPARPLIAALILGAPMFVVEMLAHYGLVSVPWRPSAGIPWPALLGFVPAFGGVFFGSAIRKLNR